MLTSFEAGLLPGEGLASLVDFLLKYIAEKPGQFGRPSFYNRSG
jgi:hypothetical protein